MLHMKFIELVVWCTYRHFPWNSALFLETQKFGYSSRNSIWNISGPQEFLQEFLRAYFQEFLRECPQQTFRDYTQELVHLSIYEFFHKFLHQYLYLSTRNIWETLQHFLWECFQKFCNEFHPEFCNGFHQNFFQDISSSRKHCKFFHSVLLEFLYEFLQQSL